MTAVSASQDESVAAVIASANLREGPGTSYAIVGRAEPGELITVSGRTQSGDWIQLAGGAWIAAFLLDQVPQNAAVIEDIPAPPDGSSSVGADWHSYRLISGDAAFSYPPDWDITDEDSTSASLNPVDGSNGSIIVTGSTTVIDFSDSTAAIRSLKSEMADRSEFDFRFLDEGVLPLPGNPIYLSASATYSGRTIGFLAVMAPAGVRTVTLLYMRIDQADVTAESLPLLTQMTTTVRP